MRSSADPYYSVDDEGNVYYGGRLVASIDTISLTGIIMKVVDADAE